MQPESFNRRAFLGAAATTAGAFLIVKPELVRGTQRNSAVRLGLLGCGGRGTGVAASFIQNTSANLVAVGDLFEDSLERSRKQLNATSEKANKPAVEPSLVFTGPDAYRRMMEAKGLDAVYIATPPYFHPQHLGAAVDASRHVYVEKPVAVDVAGAEKVRDLGETAAGKKMSLAVGFQLRHATPYVQLMERVRAGALGDVVCGLTNYYATAIERPQWPNASPNERRLRNWIYDRVLSGDIIVEQNIHLIDVTNWLMGAHPLKASGTGSRRGRRDSGDCYSHFNVNFTYPGDAHITLTSTQFINGTWDVAMKYFGTKGNAEMHYDAPVRITGEQKWEFPGLGAPAVTDNQSAASGAFKGALDDADAQKERAFIESITSGRFLNEAAQGADSALSAMLGRTAAYQGREVSWAELIRSNEEWDAKLDVRKL